MNQLVGIQGGLRSFHEQAALQHYGESVDIKYIGTFPEVFDQLRSGRIGAAVVAIANNRFNFIPEPYTMLNSVDAHNFWITGETYVKVEHQLLGSEDATLESIEEVHSQAPAIGQCMDFLTSKLPNVPRIEQADTALSAELVAKWSDPTKAAIASKGAGDLHGLKVVASNIQDDENNFTRFLVLEKRRDMSEYTGDKTSIILQTGQAAGSLNKVTEAFANKGISLATLHSTYKPNTSFTMQFFVEFNAGLQQDGVMDILQELTNKYKNRITVLGSYTAAYTGITELLPNQQQGELLL